jgi:hypothetical protein
LQRTPSAAQSRSFFLSLMTILVFKPAIPCNLTYQASIPRPVLPTGVLFCFCFSFCFHIFIGEVVTLQISLFVMVKRVYSSFFKLFVFLLF